jgi:hypothetical protein
MLEFVNFQDYPIYEMDNKTIIFETTSQWLKPWKESPDPELRGRSWSHPAPPEMPPTWPCPPRRSPQGERKNHGILAMGKWWKLRENHGKTMAKPWIYLGKPIGMLTSSSKNAILMGLTADL